MIVRTRFFSPSGAAPSRLLLAALVLLSVALAPASSPAADAIDSIATSPSPADAPPPNLPPVIVQPPPTSELGVDPHLPTPAPAAPLIFNRPIYTLKDCLDIALRQNSDLLQAKKKIEAAAGSIVQARAYFFPQLNYGGSYQYQENHWATIGINNGGEPATSWNNGITITESLYSGGANTSRLGIAHLAHSNQILAYQATIDTVLLNVRLAYYLLLLDESNLDVHRQAIELLDKQLKNEQNRFDAGLSSKSNLLRAQVTRANELPSLLNAENAIQTDYVSLSQVLNIPYKPDQDEAPFGVTGSLGFEPHAYELKDVLSKALATRPELKAAQNAIEIEQKQLVVDRANILPHLNAYGQYSISSAGDIDHPNNANDGYLVGVAASWNIFDGLATIGKMKSTRARMEGAIAARDQARLQIESEIRGALNGIETASRTVESQARNVLVARENYVLANAQYDAGLSTQLDILQARLDLTTAQTTVFQARHDYLAATARLQRALSSQFEIISDTLPPSAPATEVMPIPSAPAKSAAPTPVPGPDAAPAPKGAGGQPPLPQP